MTKKNRGLGQGLAALLRDVDEVKKNPTEMQNISGYQEILIDDISPSPYQPRKVFDALELSGLAASIKENGIIQPLVARILPTGSYELVAGERRLRAASQAGLTMVPVVLRTISDSEAMVLALVENIQREDLSPLEEAEGLLRMSKDLGMSQEEISQMLGKSRSQVANTLRLNNLPEELKEMLHKEKITAGMARALIGHPDAVQIANLSIDHNMNVRQLEELLRGIKGGNKRTRDPIQRIPKEGSRSEKPTELLPDMLRDKAVVEQSISQTLGLKVSLSIGEEKHLMSIEFNTMDDLDFLLNQLGKDVVRRTPVHKGDKNEE